MNLRGLIDSLHIKMESGHITIKNIHLIIEKLEEMDSMIEMEDVKNAFVSQLLLILMMRQRGYVPPFKKMHAVLSGPPGVGKTTLSILIAQIWSLLNILDKSTPDETPSTLNVVYKKDISHTITEVRDKLTDTLLALDRKYEDSEEGEIPDFIKAIYKRSQDSYNLCNQVIENYDPSRTPKRKPKPPTRDSYIVVGRGDFVSDHVGGTSQKTKALLDENKGKVIIIEEAYLLYTGEKDSFGMEALTLINRYMDEFQDDYIFIFNGYEEHLNDSIFKAQPGLRRRIQWTFNIDKYSAKGLFQIFEHQLSRFIEPKWKLDINIRNKVRKFFEDNRKIFPYFGGSTELLVLKCQLQYGKHHFEKNIHTDPEICVICQDVFEAAILEFRKDHDKIHKEIGPPPGMFM